MSQQESRRKFIKKAAYVAPAIASLSAMPALATYGSVVGTGPGTQPGTGPGTSPGTQPGSPGTPPGTGGPGSYEDD